MKITFTGRQEKLAPNLERKLATRFAKLSKMIERRGEKAAHVVLSAERHVQKAEVQVNYYDHPLVGIATAPDQFTAVMEATDKLEKQVVKLRAKWRDTKRTPEAKAAAESKKAPAKVREPKRKTVKEAAKPNGKPMTVAEAVLAMEEHQDYMVYQDAETMRKSVLVRRRDGKIDVVEP